jgi:hypothetical protein
MTIIAKYWNASRWEIMGRFGSWLVLLGLFAWAGACSSDDAKDTAALAEGCLINTDCNAPLVCAFRRCHTECADSRDCEPGQRCVASDRPFHVCQLAEERDCTYNSDCPSGELCGVDLQCRDQCMADRDCVRNQVCVGGTCADPVELQNGELPVLQSEAGIEAGGGQPCLYTSECEAPLICKNQFCSRECLAPADCAMGYDCVNSRCIAGSGTLIGAEGGAVTAMGGKVKLTIAPGSLHSSVSILILAVEAWPDGALGPVFQLVPSGLAFDPPATLTYLYTADDIGTVAPSALRLANAVGSAWIPLNSTVDATGGSVSAQLAHLSIYGLVSAASGGAADAGDARAASGADASDSGLSTTTADTGASSTPDAIPSTGADALTSSDASL